MAAVSAIPDIGDDPTGAEYMELLPYKRFRVGDRVVGETNAEDDETMSAPMAANQWTRMSAVDDEDAETVSQMQEPNNFTEGSWDSDSSDEE